MTHADYCDRVENDRRDCTCDPRVGTTKVYHAANGHTMEAPIIGIRHDGTVRIASYDAWCASGCVACREGYDLPDW